MAGTLQEEKLLARTANSGVVSWFQKVIGRCKRPYTKDVSDDMSDLVLHHF
jgi:hypothetical protein